MNVVFSDRAIRSLRDAPAIVQKAFKSSSASWFEISATPLFAPKNTTSAGTFGKHA